MNFRQIIESKKKVLLGLPLVVISISELVEILKSIIINKKKVTVFGYSAGIYPRIKELPELVSLFKKFDILVADGTGIPLVAKLFGVQMEDRVGIPNLTFELLKLADELKLKILLFGATKFVNDQAVLNIHKKYPNIVCAHGIDGYFQKQDELNIIKAINKENPDILFIGISSPMKEYFAINYKDKLNTKVILPCGGMIDVLADKVKRPLFTIKWIPTTWFFRFIQEPRRLYRTTLKSVLEFVFKIFPILYLKHILRIERNPSIVKHLKLNKLYL